MPEIALIGAGSVVFAKTLIGDILQTPALAGSHIRLMDINPARLKVAEDMVTRMVARLGVPARVSATLDRTEAIRGAHFVICSIQVGGQRPAVSDFDIPKKFGLRQTIADTLGIGGIFRGLRTIPEVLKIARDIADFGAPGCLLLNYTNPMAILCRAVDRAVGIPCAGMCHSIQGTARQLSTYAGIDHDSMTYRVAGINHMAFFLDFRTNGQDAYPLLFRLLDDPAFASDRVRFEMMRRTGYFVTESSEHQAEYTPYFLPHGENQIRKFDIPLDELLRRDNVNAQSWEKTERELLGGPGGEIRIDPRGHEYASFIIEARTTGRPCVVYGNVPNRGLIPNLPPGCVIEVPVLVDGNGLQPTAVTDFPEVLAGICRTNVNVQELAVEAALTGRRESIYHAAMLDPLTAATLPLDRIWALCDEMIDDAQKSGWLGDFAPVVAGTGRAARGMTDRAVARLRSTSPSSTAPGAVHKLELSLERGPDFDAQAPLDFSFTASDKGLVPDRLELASNAADPVALEVVFPSGYSGSARVDMHCNHAGVLCLGAVLRERKVLRDGKSFAINLAGFPAVHGTFRFTDDRLALAIEVKDSNVNPFPSAPWQGSAVELFFASEKSPTPSQFCLVPFPDKGTVSLYALPDLREVPLESRILHTQPGSYTAEIVLPLEILPEGRLLVDIIVDIGALGDAHSGGRAALNDRFGSNASSDHFAFLERVPGEGSK